MNTVAGVTGGGSHFSGNRVDPRRLEPDSPGEHVWTVMALYRVRAKTIQDAVEGGPSIQMDAENIAAISAGCFVCEQDYQPRLIHRRCPGPPKEG